MSKCEEKTTVLTNKVNANHNKPGLNTSNPIYLTDNEPGKALFKC